MASSDSDPVVGTQELCEHLDLTRETVGKLVQKGVLRRLGKGKWNESECRLAYIRYLREVSAGRYAGGVLDLAQERARLAKSQTQKTDLELAKRRGELVELEVCRAQWQDEIVRCRSRLLRIPSKIASQMASAQDPAQAQELITGEIHEALLELAGNIRGDAPDTQGPEAVAAPSRPKRKRVGGRKSHSHRSRKRRARKVEDLAGALSP